MGGYAGKILYIDLTTGNIQAKPLEPEFAREYIGGLGFGTRIYFDLIKGKPDFDALSPDNPFVLMTGPLTGMKMNAVARWALGTKSPLTGFWGDSNVGGYFGAELKFAGFDGIVVTGASETPVSICIDDGRVRTEDAQKYWGKDIYTVNDEIIADHKSESSRRPGQVLAIGLAGENLVKFASVINNKGHAAGRTGIGAVWGAKKLKAIFVRGTGKLEAAHPDRLKELREELREVYDGNITIEALKAFGTASHMDIGIISGDVPVKNWQQTEWDMIDEIGPVAYGEKILTRNKTCYACGVMCKREAEVKEGPFKFEKGPGPEYETIASFGSLCLNPSIESVGKANDICNRYGMDTITCGAAIAFATECFENGLITVKDTDGLELTWGNSEAIVALTEKIGKREGFGAILSEGSARAAKRIGGNASDFLTTVKGLESPMHDPRSAHGYGLAYAVSPRGACHNASLQYPIEGGGMFLPEFEELADEVEQMSSEGKAGLNVLSQDFGMFFSNCAIFCNLGAMILTATQAADMVNHVTGQGYTVEELVKLGRRVWYLKRGLSNLFGARAAHDRLPKRLMTPMTGGPTEGSVPDMDKMLREFYELRGFDENGIPRKGILEELGLAELAELLRGK
ncbi:aldehyde ferredoxin oxidoreductase family protein [Desulfococcaceae bacterium HSG8]|nr:aldehyde ferredoxin oxidoreductase family protein [Desulfococcaceae bacterium HSG8]